MSGFNFSLNLSNVDFLCQHFNAEVEQILSTQNTPDPDIRRQRGHKNKIPINKILSENIGLIQVMQL